MKAIVRFDGGARPRNPGHAGFCCTVKLEDGTRSGPFVLSRYIGIKTNNEAEYIGAIVGIKYAHFLGADQIVLIGDSKIVINHITGKWRCKEPHLKVYRDQARDLLDRHFAGEYTLKYEGRDNNTLADTYCTYAINWGRNQNPFTPSSIKAKRGNAQICDPFQSERQPPRFRAAGSVRLRAMTRLLSEISVN